jgi:hypothetical protein
LASYINNDRKAAIDSFLEVTAEPWGTPVIQSLKDAAKLMDEQDIPLTGRALFVPGYGVFEQEEDPESVKILQEDDQEYEDLLVCDPDVVGFMEENDQIDRSFLIMIRAAHSHKAFFVESKLRELHRELLAIVNIEEGD